jgi:hypothetical protein
MIFQVRPTHVALFVYLQPIVLQAPLLQAM